MTTAAVTSNLAPVQLLGLGTNLDVNSIVSALEGVQQIPLTNLQSQVTSYQTEVSAYGQLSGALAGFQASLSSLEDGSVFQTQSATVGNSSVGSATVSTSNNQTIANATHTLAVSQLAQTQFTASSDVSSSTATVGTGTLTIQLGTYGTGNTSFTPSATPAATITIGSGNSSLSGIASAINAANAGVSASIVNDGTGARLVLTSSTTGAANGFKVSVADGDGNNTDAAGLSGLAYDPTRTGGTPQTTLLQSAQNANLSIDGIAITSASNTVSDALQGVSINLAGTTATNAPTTLTISQNTSAANSAIQSFVSNYNSLLGTVQSLTANTPGSASNGPLAADPSVNVITGDLQNIVASVFNTGNPAIQSLNDLGIAFQEDGTLTLNQSTLSGALAKSPGAVAQLFSDTGSSSDSLIQYQSATSATQNGNYALNLSQIASQGSLVGSASAGLTITQGSNDTFAAIVDGVSANVTVPAGTYASASSLAAAVQAAINGTPAFANGGVSVNVTQSGGVLSIAPTDFGSHSSVTLDNGSGAQNLFGATPVSTSGADVAGTLAGFTFTGSGQTITAAANSPAAGLVLSQTGGVIGSRGTISYSQGIGAQLDNALTQYLDPTNGIIATATQGLTSTITHLQSQETELQANLQTQQATLISEFTAMTELVQSLNQTSSFLSQSFGTSNSSSSSSSNSGGSLATNAKS